jgi:hypothetical protein
VIAWYFEDESTPATDALRDRVADAGAMVPSLWRPEVASVFQTAIRQQRIDAVYRDDSLAELALMPITVDAETSSYAWSATLRLAEQFSLCKTSARLGLLLPCGTPRPDVPVAPFDHY